jgi:LPXTG-motif cell wall-anchored protein
MTAGGAYYLDVDFVSATSALVGGNLTLTSNAGFSAMSFTDNGAAAASVFQFQLNGTAVPEPGTLLLGGIAALTGGGGVWWKRRRKGAGNSNPTESAVN